MTLAPSQTPDAGYMGDRRRGAGHGRASVDPHALIASLQRDIADYTRRADDHESDPKLDWHIWPAGSDERAAMIADARASGPSDDYAPRVHLAGIRLDSGGYDQGGAYWGTGGWLWEAWTDDGAYYETGRVSAGSAERREALERLRAAGHEWPSTAQIDRETAKGEIRESLPGVRFYR